MLTWSRVMNFFVKLGFSALNLGILYSKTAQKLRNIKWLVGDLRIHFSASFTVKWFYTYFTVNQEGTTLIFNKRDSFNIIGWMHRMMPNLVCDMFRLQKYYFRWIVILLLYNSEIRLFVCLFVCLCEAFFWLMLF